MRFRRMYEYSPHKDLGGGIEDLEKSLKREIQIARNIQSTLLNGNKPKLPAGEVSGISVPARLIGGDYFDFYPLNDGKIRMIIGDVMGKGIPAAMLMILTRGAFRSAAGSTSSPSETLTAMNKALFTDLRKLGSFVTVFCADWDADSKKFTYASAGHSLPIFVRRYTEVIQAVKAKGVMLGGLPNHTYMEEQITLQESDLVFFYTDGIVEAQNKEGSMFKQERLIEVLLGNGRLQNEEIEQAVIDAINKFTDGLPQKDDITMVTLKVGQAVS